PHEDRHGAAALVGSRVDQRPPPHRDHRQPVRQNLLPPPRRRLGAVPDARGRRPEAPMISLRPHFEGKSHVIWDWNGTLLDDVDLCVEIVQGMLERHGLARIGLAEYQSVFRFPVREYYKDVGFDFAKTPFEAVSEDFMSTYLDRVLEARLFGGAVDLI